MGYTRSILPFGASLGHGIRKGIVLFSGLSCCAGRSLVGIQEEMKGVMTSPQFETQHCRIVMGSGNRALDNIYKQYVRSGMIL